MPKKKEERATTEKKVEKKQEEMLHSVQENEDAQEETPAQSTKKEGYVEYCLPFVPGKEMGDFQTVTLNGKNYQVQYGVTQLIPLGVKEILEDMLLSKSLIKKKVDELTKEDKCIAKFED